MHTPDTQWKGYTLDEIRMRMIINLTRMELEKAKLSSLTEGYVNPQKKFLSSPIMSKIYGALDYFDYASLAFSLGKRVFKLFRKKKN